MILRDTLSFWKYKNSHRYKGSTNLHVNGAEINWDTFTSVASLKLSCNKDLEFWVSLDQWCVSISISKSI